MLNGYVEKSKAELLMFDADNNPEWFAIVAPVAIFDDDYQHLGTKWVCTDGNILAVLNEKPDTEHPVWSDGSITSPYVFNQIMFPYQCYTVELGDCGDYGHVADDCFSILITAVNLYKTVEHDPDTWDYMITA